MGSNYPVGLDLLKYIFTTRKCGRGRKVLKAKAVKDNQSVGRVFQIIEVMSRNPGPMRLQDISRKIKVPASSVLRFLNTLMKHSYVDQEPETLRYYLTMKFCQIGSLVSSQMSIRDIVRPYLVELSEKCQESACLAIERDNAVVYIDVVEGPDSMLKTLQRIGKLAPLHSTGVGKSLLVDFDEKRLDRLIEQKGLKALTKNTVTTKDRLLVELEKVRSGGYALDDEECEYGVRCVAAPVRNYTGKIVASISVSGPVSRLPSEKMDYIKEHIIKTSQKISKQLGFESLS
jgi:IclR family KDG regulon transcriptional repressor